MMKILQISSELNSGSVGRIAEQIGEKVIEQNWESYIAYARDHQPSQSMSIQIGHKLDLILHGLYTRVTDRHGFASRRATKKLIKKIKAISPNIIHLHHLHGYFINIELLFVFLAECKIPVVWTFHDCWSFTGHCAHYEYVGCDKWLMQCNKCPQKKEYPQSFFVDRSYRNYIDKKRIFNSISDLTIVPVSNWLGRQVERSFLKHQKIKVIQNGVDLDKFSIQKDGTLETELRLKSKYIVLGVASPWSDKKGLNTFIELSKKLDVNYQIILIGLTPPQITKLPKNIIGIERTESVRKLAEYYSLANVFVNPTLEDTFPSTNLESLACGTPVITFKSGGSPEAVDNETGIVVDKLDLDRLILAIYEICDKPKTYYQKTCRERAERHFDKQRRFSEYIQLYKEILT